MTVARPQYCLENAYDLFAAQLQDLDADGALLRAAVAISMHEMPEVDYRQVEDRLQGLANRVLARVRSDNPKALLAHAHAVLFDEEKFIGNVENYYDPANSYIPAVLESKRGIPITLCLIYKEVLERVGLHVVGTNSPGHFLASVWVDGNPMIIDPFTRGRVLSRAEAHDRIMELVGTIDDETDLLKAASNRGWLGRILQNLSVVFGQSRLQASLAAMLELQSLLTHSDDS
jgi:regulator of sirC expression with transglutaminase-like and TPR domain